MRRFFDILGNILISLFMLAIIVATVNCYLGLVVEGSIAEFSKVIYYSFGSLTQNFVLLSLLIIVALYVLRAIFTERVFTKIIFILLAAMAVICICFPNLLTTIFGEIKLIL